MYLYYKERSLEGTVKTDSGATVRSIVKSLQTFGVCKENYHPYIIKNFAKPPSFRANMNARLHKIKSYHSVKNINEIKNSLYTNMPVIIGMDVFESLESKDVAATGIMTMPQPTEKNLGGHAVLVVGYDDTKNHLIVRNSWGEKWGDKGYFYMPYDYVNTGYTFDYWTVL